MQYSGPVHWGRKGRQKQNTVNPTASSTKAPDESQHLVLCTRSCSPIPTLRALGSGRREPTTPAKRRVQTNTACASKQIEPVLRRRGKADQRRLLPSIAAVHVMFTLPSFFVEYDSAGQWFRFADRPLQPRVTMGTMRSHEPTSHGLLAVLSQRRIPFDAARLQQKS